METHQPTTRHKVTRWLLFSYCLLLGLYSGAATLQNMNMVTTLWLSPAESAFYYFNQSFIFPILSLLILLLAIVLIIVGWRSPQPTRKWLFISTLIVLAIQLASAVYFVPNIIQVSREFAGRVVAAVELEQRLGLWVRLDLLRQFAGIVALGAGTYSYGLLRLSEGRAGVVGGESQLE